MFDETDLLAELQDPTGQANESIDLLSEISEDNGKAWAPAKYDDHPRGIQGRVTHVSTVETDPRYGAVRQVPYIELIDKDGTTWSVRAFHGVLENQIRKVDPKPGDFIALKYFGKKSGKTGNDYHNYAAAIRKAAA